MNLTSLLWTVRWSGESRIPIRWIWLMCYARWFQKPSRCISNNDLRKVYITDFFKAQITTDSIKIFSITFFTLVTVYCTCKIANDVFRCVLYVTTRFVLNQWFFYDCKYVVDMYNVICYWKALIVFVLWINKLKCSLKTSVSLVLATEHLKL